MSALTATPYTSWVIFPERAGFQESAAFYYGAQWDRTHELAIGAKFGVVYSPSQFSLLYNHWRYARFEVRMCRFREKGDLERGYAEISKRPLTAEEAAFFEGEWWRLREEMKRADETVELSVELA
jgi:hypothetical protein